MTLRRYRLTLGLCFQVIISCVCPACNTVHGAIHTLPRRSAHLVPTTMSTPDYDEGTRSTDGSAAHARISAARAGYISDDFLPHMVPRSKHLPSQQPLIHIGTFHRAESIDRLFHNFLALDNGCPKQIVSLGAGSDTRFWRLMVRIGDRLNLWASP